VKYFVLHSLCLYFRDWPAPVINGVLLRDELGISTDHPRRYIGPLAEAGIVVEFTDRARNRAWRAPEVLDALDDFAERAGRRG